MTRRLRWLKTGTAYCETQRTVDRQFLLKPSKETRNIVGACAGRALKKYPVKLFWLDVNINHKHVGRAALSDSAEHLENLFRFDQLFNSLVTRELNRIYDREGPLFSTRNRTHEATDDSALEQQLFYAVTNVVKDGLVDRVSHWEGVSSYNQLATGQVDTYTYIDRTAWHRAGGRHSKKPPEAFTKTVTLELSPLPEWEHMSPGKRQAHFRREVRCQESAFREVREREGRTAMGRKKLAKVDPRDRPKTSKPKTRQPVCHSSTFDYYASNLWMGGFWNVGFPSGSIRPPPLRVCT
ncbi:MAG: hypothetical protein JRH20_32350 [Deltaproteobacteria bacterium]|nr:hypothetical protein [Deltaproteobacteria bacterium]